MALDRRSQPVDVSMGRSYASPGAAGELGYPRDALLLGVS
jgi:hypothetical protein